MIYKRAEMSCTEKRLRWLLGCALIVQCLLLPRASAENLDPRKDHEDPFRNVDAVVERAVAEGNIPGAVLLVGHNGKVVHRKAFGWRALEPVREPMTLDTVFDLASLTKCIATTTSVMQLVQD